MHSHGPASICVHIMHTPVDSINEWTVIAFDQTQRRPAGKMAIQKRAGERDSYACFMMIFVHPDYRRQGVARSMISSSLRYCLSLGVTDVGLCVRPDNDTAIALYESMGFENVGPVGMDIGYRRSTRKRIPAGSYTEGYLSKNVVPPASH
jgi:GNAT superfamily N-acetyltransferase